MDSVRIPPPSSSSSSSSSCEVVTKTVQGGNRNNYDTAACCLLAGTFVCGGVSASCWVADDEVSLKQSQRLATVRKTSLVLAIVSGCAAFATVLIDPTPLHRKLITTTTTTKT